MKAVSLVWKVCIVVLIVGTLLFPGISFSQSMVDQLNHALKAAEPDVNPNLQVNLYNVKIVKIGRTHYNTQTYKMGSGYRGDVPYTVETIVTAPAIVSANFKCKGRVHKVQDKITLTQDPEWGGWKKLTESDIWVLKQEAKKICQ